jgi:hypothetical protein
MPSWLVLWLLGIFAQTLAAIPAANAAVIAFEATRRGQSSGAGVLSRYRHHCRATQRQHSGLRALHT